MNAIPTLISVLLMGAIDVPRNMVLNNKPGIYAATHVIYLGIAVKEAIIDNLFDGVASQGWEETISYPKTL